MHPASPREPRIDARPGEGYHERNHVWRSDIIAGRSLSDRTEKKRETADEVTALAQVMREFSRRIHPKINGYLLDTYGTGVDIKKKHKIKYNTTVFNS